MNIDDLKLLVEQELAEEQFSGRTHGRGSTYRDGCRGPLCQRANRNRHKRLRTGEAANGYQAILDRMLEPFQKQHEQDKADLKSQLLQQKGA